MLLGQQCRNRKKKFAKTTTAMLESHKAKQQQAAKSRMVMY
jgi:hypothetical protein